MREIRILYGCFTEEYGGETEMREEIMRQKMLKDTIKFNSDERDKFLADYLSAREDGVTSKRKAYAIAKTAAINERRRYPSFQSLIRWTIYGVGGLAPTEKSESLPRWKEKTREIATEEQPVTDEITGGDNA